MSGHNEWENRPWDTFFRALHRALHDDVYRPDPDGVHGSLWGHIHEMLHGLGYVDGHEGTVSLPRAPYVAPVCPECGEHEIETVLDAAGRATWTCLKCRNEWAEWDMLTTARDKPHQFCPKCGQETIVRDSLTVDRYYCQECWASWCEWPEEATSDQHEVVDDGDDLDPWGIIEDGEVSDPALDAELQSIARTIDKVCERVGKLIDTLYEEDVPMAWPKQWIRDRFWPRLRAVIRSGEDHGYQDQEQRDA
jgi:predicted RNA-binding Zn-ribbon protein involved in translation (DUF1610 family)